jgi:hypothetical protein
MILHIENSEREKKYIEKGNSYPQMSKRAHNEIDSPWQNSQVGMIFVFVINHSINSF